MLENANENKPTTLIKRLSPDNTETNVTRTFKPKNYSVPMDYSGDELLFIYKKAKKKIPEAGPDFLVCIYDLNFMMLKELANFKDNIKIMRLFKKGFVYVRDNKSVLYFDSETGQDQFIYSHPLTIVTMAIYNSRIATIDKDLNLNIFDYDSMLFLHNMINIFQIKEIPREIVNLRLFEMEYPYFSVLNSTHFAFTSDFGIVSINYKPS